MKPSARHKVGSDPISSAFKSLVSSAGAVIAISFFINLLMLTGPLYMLQMYDRVLASGSVQTLLAISAITLVLFGTYWLLDAIRAKVMTRVANTLDTEVSDDAFIADVRTPLKPIRQGSMSEPIRELDRLRAFVGGRGIVAFFDLMWAPLFFAIMFMFHPWLGYLALTGGIILFLLAILNEVATRRVNLSMNIKNQKRMAFSREVRQNIEALAALGMLSRLSGKWRKANGEYIEASTQAADWMTWFASASKTVRLMLQSAVLGLGAYLAVQGVVSPGVMIAASIIASRAVAPVEQVVANWPAFLAARQALGRLKSVFAQAPVTNMQRAFLPLPSKNLSVSNLAAMPPGSKRPHLQGVRFELVAGDGVGVVGPSASGKSTLARALVGVWASTNGSIRLDGATPGQWEPERLGQAIGYLPQSVGLMEGTVSEVISRFDSKAPSEEVLEAAEIAGVHEMILNLPDGYNTPIGEGGAVLSAGQRQRLALARALFRKPFLVVLDEPNSNLDVEGEEALNQAIGIMRKSGSIVIVIAHRNSALDAVNKVLVLRNGRQVGFGSREDFLKTAALQRSLEQTPQVASVPRSQKEALSIVHEA